MSKFYRLLEWLFRTEKWAGWITHEDATCVVYCNCHPGELEGLWAHDGKITWCDKCGAGYRTEFRVCQYPRFLRGKIDP